MTDATKMAHPEPAGELVAEALAARPLLEQVARMSDRIGQHTVGEIMAISDRAAAWLADNPPGQPVAIEPRGCPTPGACSCVEPQPVAVVHVDHFRGDPGMANTQFELLTDLPPGRYELAITDELSQEAA